MERMYVNCPKVFGTEETLSESRPQAHPQLHWTHLSGCLLTTRWPVILAGCAVASSLGAGF